MYTYLIQSLVNMSVVCEFKNQTAFWLKVIFELNNHVCRVTVNVGAIKKGKDSEVCVCVVVWRGR